MNPNQFKIVTQRLTEERDIYRQVLVDYLSIKASGYATEADECIMQECHRLGIIATKIGGES